MRILVCGGRKYSNYSRLNFILSEYLKEGDILIHGGATGADSLAGQWLKSKGWSDENNPIVFDADWDDLSHPDAVIKYTKFGKPYDSKAGSRRNKKMLDEGKPDLVIAFPGGYGTGNMIKQSKQAGIKVIEV